MIKNNNMLIKAFFLCGLAFVAFSCNDDFQQPYYQVQEAGKIVINGYAESDSIQLAANGELLEINDKNTFIKSISKNYEFVFYGNTTETIDIKNKLTGEIIHSYSSTVSMPLDSLSFYYKPGIFLDNVLSFKPGILSQTGYTGYKFIFPNMNTYSSSGYNGPLDGIIRKNNGQLVGTVQNITKEGFSTFTEFQYGAPPILKMELVKHGTTESYITGQPVFITLVMQNNKSKLVVLEEKVNQNGVFSGVDGNIDLADYFDF